MNYEYLGLIPSNIGIVCSKISLIISQVENYYSDDDLLFNLRLVLSELLINSCEHGNKNDKTKNINLRVKVKPSYVFISISDEGNGFKIKDIDFKKTNYTCSGRGLKLVTSICSTFKVEKNTIYCEFFF